MAESTFLALQNPRIIESCLSNKETTILVYQNRTNNNHDFKDKDKDEAKAIAKDGCSTAVLYRWSKQNHHHLIIIIVFSTSPAPLFSLVEELGKYSELENTEN